METQIQDRCQQSKSTTDTGRDDNRDPHRGHDHKVVFHRGRDDDGRAMRHACCDGWSLRQVRDKQQNALYANNIPVRHVPARWQRSEWQSIGSYGPS